MSPLERFARSFHHESSRARTEALIWGLVGSVGVVFVLIAAGVIFEVL